MWQSIKNIYHLLVAVLANIYYGFPSKKLTVIGVTGTDGKTTTVNMIYQVLKSSGKKVSMVSSINAVIAGKPYDTGFHVSSPDSFTVQKFAKKSVEQGDKFLVLEVTSHGLDQYRFWGINFAIGVITNITHDHLDYHKNWENYFSTKAKLIKDVKVAVLNFDEDHFEKLATKIKGKVVSFGSSSKADFNPKKFPLKLTMLGDYNELNALAAAAVSIQEKIPQKNVKKVLENFSHVKGRMEEVKNNRGIRIIIDFASTPNSLKQALKTLKAQTKGKLIAVFGSAGKRDIAKRRLMGEISAKRADVTVITSEDPRGFWNEIREQMVDGAKKGGAIEVKSSKLKVKSYDEHIFFVIYSRNEAVDFAINMVAKKGDTIGFFGKGHEKSMNYDGKTEEAYDEFDEVKKALHSKKNNE